MSGDIPRAGFGATGAVGSNPSGGGGGGGGGAAGGVAWSSSAPRVLLVDRPELELIDLYVVRRNGLGDREAFVLGSGDGAPATGWWLVAQGSEAHRLARLPAFCGAVDLFTLDAALEPVRRYLRHDAL